METKEATQETVLGAQPLEPLKVRKKTRETVPQKGGWREGGKAGEGFWCGREGGGPENAFLRKTKKERVLRTPI